MDEIFGTNQSVNPTRKKSAIYVWGYNQSGQTGRKGKEWQLRIPKQLPPQLFACPAAGLNSRWFDIACGREHTAAVASDGSLFTWGIIPIHPLSLLIIMISSENLKLIGNNEFNYVTIVVNTG
jgi:alpha-tubulin suppressor-like RCC1 family protein|uniref:Regulator of chromosome condensation 1/beta-lactamase-inhibitor protein II n=1 Tax=Fagus sylvatica TaxID=28930 RepID=A0A2N9HMX0_FAGSY